MQNENENEIQEKGNKGTRNRRTRAQVMEDLRAKLARMEAKAAGNFDETSEDTYGVKRLKRAIRSRETALAAAGTLLNGRKATDKSPQVANIDEKIANAEKRVADLKMSKKGALEVQAHVPSDIETLRALLESATKGEAIEFPTTLYRLKDEADKTDADHEASEAIFAGDSL